MWTVVVVVRGVLGKYGIQVPLADDEHPVGALSTCSAHPSFCEGVRPGYLGRSLDHVDAGASEHGVEGSGELRIAVAEQEPQPSRALVEVYEQIACLLGHPGAGRVGGHPDHVDLAGGELDEEQYVDAFEEIRCRW
jgi:hypothetical protein